MYSRDGLCQFAFMHHPYIFNVFYLDNCEISYLYNCVFVSSCSFHWSFVPSSYHCGQWRGQWLLPLGDYCCHHCRNGCWGFSCEYMKVFWKLIPILLNSLV